MSVRVNASDEGLRRTTSLPSPTSFTIAGWINRRGAVTATSFGSITSMLNATLSAGIGMSILQSTTTVRIGNGPENVSVGVDLDLDTWYYFAMGCDGLLSNSLTGWIIEEDLTVHTISIAGLSFTSASMRLLNISEAALWLDASVANVMVWDSKLTTSQLLAQMVTSNPQVTPHLWTPLNLHTNLNDISGNSRDWSMTGGTLSTDSNPTIPYLTDVDLVPFSSTPNAITVTENETVLLDLVTFSSITNDISLVDNENTELDLSTYTNTVYDIVVLENELVFLDLVSHSTTVNDLYLLENDLVSLDLVSFSSSANDISVLEHDLVLLDLVSYSVVFDDLDILENELVSIDLVSFSVTVYDVELLEESDIALDLVAYSVTVNDLSITDQDLSWLDLVSYSIEIYDLTMDTETELTLDLVLYTSIINTIAVISSSGAPPAERTYLVESETRLFSVQEEDRIFSIELEQRILTINH